VDTKRLLRQPHQDSPDTTLFGDADLNNAEAFLASLGPLSAGWQKTGENWPRLAERLQHFMAGSSGHDLASFDGILAKLMETPWKGKAADEFAQKAAEVRAFWVKVIANACHAAEPAPTGVPQSMQYEYGKLPTLQGASQQLVLTMRGQFTLADSARTQWLNWLSNIVQLIGVLKYNGIEMPCTIPTFEQFASQMPFGNFDATPVEPAAASAEPIQTSYNYSWNGRGAATIKLSNTGPWQSTVTYTGPAGPSSNPYIYWTGVNAMRLGGSDALGSTAVGAEDEDHYLKLQDMLLQPEYGTYLRTILTTLGDLYGKVTSPEPAVAPDMGTGDSQTQQPGYPPAGFPDAGSYSGGTPLGGSSHGTSPLDSAGYHPALANSGYDPTRGIDGFDPAAAGSGFDPYGSLADAGLPGGGSGLFTPGSGSGLGASGGGLGAGGLGTGAGAGDLAGTGAGGLSAAAGRGGIPMSPMGGAGGGKENKERQRQSWLPEEDDVWGADTDAVGPVL
jgi:hypothetical protein